MIESINKYMFIINNNLPVDIYSTSLGDAYDMCKMMYKQWHIDVVACITIKL